MLEMRFLVIEGSLVPATLKYVAVLPIHHGNLLSALLRRTEKGEDEDLLWSSFVGL